MSMICNVEVLLLFSGDTDSSAVINWEHLLQRSRGEFFAMHHDNSREDDTQRDCIALSKSL